MGTLNLGKVAVALLGLLAYQNRDKLGDMIQGRPADPNNPNAGGTDGGLLGGATGGLKDILDRFRNSGAGEKVDSWVGTGANQPIETHQVEKAIDPDTLDQLAQQTGLTREELLARITKDLPEAVDKMTPHGTLPDEPASRAQPTLLDDVKGTERQSPWATT